MNTLHFLGNWTPFSSLRFIKHIFDSFSVELSHSCVTFTQCPCFFLRHWSPVLIIILFRLSHIFVSLSKWNYTTFFCANVTQVLYKGISIPFKWTLSKNCFTLLCMTVIQRRVEQLFFPFESFMTHSYFSAERTATHSFLHYKTGHSTWLLLGHFPTQFSLLHCRNWYLKENPFFSVWVSVTQHLIVQVLHGFF